MGDQKFLTPILLPGDPTLALHASTKQYVDTGLAGRLSLTSTSIVGNQDLNTYTTAGNYHQSANVNASGGTNYPAPYAGLLEVRTSGTTFIYQRYTVYQGGGSVPGAIYTRCLYTSTWSPWVKLVNSLDYTAADVLAKLKTVDGSGSGLDADLLDGQSGSYYVDTATSQTIAGKKTFSANVLGTTASSKWPALGGFVGDLHPESGNPLILPFITNDLAYLTSRGGTCTTNYASMPNGSTAWFDGTASYGSLTPANLPAGGIVITVMFPTRMNWGTKLGIHFGSPSWRAQNITLEVFSVTANAWVTVDSTTGWPDATYQVSYGSDTNGITGLRFTLDNWAKSTDGRIAQIYAVGYQSPLLKQVFVGRDGGDLYGTLKFNTLTASQYLELDSGQNVISVAKADAFNKPFGTIANTVAMGNHTHSSFASDLSIAGDLLPDADNVRSLGSATLMWKDIYVGPGSLYLNGQKVLEDTQSGTIKISADPGQNISVQTQGTGDVELAPQGTGLIQLKGTVLFQAGSLIRSTDGSALTFDDPIQFSAGTGIVGGLTIDGNTAWHSGNFTPSTKVNTSLLGVANGVATLGSDGLVLPAQLPAVSIADGSLTIAKTSGLQAALDAKLASSVYTATDVLAKLKTVDGAGSGLDADTLTGLAAGSFRRLYPITDTSGTAQYIKLGTLTIAQNGRHAIIRIASSVGYNANLAQNALTEIHFKTSNGTSVDANGFAGDSWYYSIGRSAGAVTAVKWVANAAGGAATSYDLYASFSSFSGQGAFYSVEAPVGTWTHAGSLGQTDPGVGSSTVLVATNELYLNGAVAWTKSNDGAGSGMDADLLDGQDGSYYLSAANLTGTLSAARSWALTGDVTSPAGSSTTTIANGVVTNAKLANSTITVGTTSIALGASATTLAGLASVTSTSFTGALTGNASTASKWATARTLTLTGITTGSVSLDGSANVSLATAIADATLAISMTNGLQSALDDKVSISATGLGVVGSKAFDGVTNTAAAWGALPVGYARMMSTNIGLTGGAPVANYGYFLKVASRDTGSGWGGLWAGYSAGQNYIGRASTNAVTAQWDKLWSDANDGSGSGLDADLLDGQQGSYYNDLAHAVGVLTVAHGGTGLSTLTPGDYVRAADAATLEQRTPDQVRADISATTTTQSDTPPTNPNPGDRWLLPSTGREYEWYFENGTGQWVDLSAGAVSGPATQVYAQSTQPADSGTYLWIQTGLGDDGNDFTIWFNDGK